MIYDDEEAIKKADPSDLWVYDKYILSRTLGYVCGAKGEDVPRPGEYIIRPCINLLGMGQGAQISFIHTCSDHIPDGYFWCEIFYGRHFSVDYIDAEPVLSVEGFKRSDTLSEWGVWIKRDLKYALPPELRPIAKKYRYMNVEYIDGKPIEVHLRLNPDFRDHNSNYVLPVWDQVTAPLENEEFIESHDAGRLGFIVSKD